MKTRFAPSPTGKLHIGNARTALINYLLTKKNNGKFLLRIDDTDIVRSKNEYKEAIIKDLSWLGIEWDDYFCQNDRLSRYEEQKNYLINSGRLYPCYETPEELEIKRKFQLSSGKPPIYDRSALKLSQEQISTFEKAGRKRHYRFLINDAEITWHDQIKGKISYQGANLSDPVIIREDGSMTYMLCSTIDDIDYDITHIIRGEDHVSNTAIQIQMFEALGRSAPNFGHLSLIKAKDEKISKRIGGFDIESLRDKTHIEPMALNSFLALIGSSKSVDIYKSIDELLEIFDINSYSTSPTTYLSQELEILNHKLIIKFNYEDIKTYLHNNQLKAINEQFWLAVRPNLNKISDVKIWWDICNNSNIGVITDKDLLAKAAELLPHNINENTWQEWTRSLSSETGKKGKDLFMPIRLALTGAAEGPELKNLLPLLTYDEIIHRLTKS